MLHNPVQQRKTAFHRRCDTLRVRWQQLLAEYSMMPDVDAETTLDSLLTDMEFMFRAARDDVLSMHNDKEPF